MTASDPRVGEIAARLAKKPGVQGMYSFHGTDVAYLLAELADRDEKLARVEALGKYLDTLAPGDKHYASLIRAAVAAATGDGAS